jgi:protein-S-isoprenylcysteine O-methyltransferase Ste14
MAQVLFVALLQAVVLFTAAGDTGWGWGWVSVGVYLGVLALGMALSGRVAHRKELIAERGQVRADAKRWDRTLAPLAALVGPLVTLLVAGLDHRFDWTLPLAGWVHGLGLALTILGYLIVYWAMATNAYFSGVVRIQKERGHQVVSGGPYRLVRHPGYVGMILFNLTTPLLLGSLWALIPAGLTAVLFIVRTTLEDRTLQAELPGYLEYSQRTRYRLLPGVW